MSACYWTNYNMFVCRFLCVEFRYNEQDIKHITHRMQYICLLTAIKKAYANTCNNHMIARNR
jgi:hypothetical protein